MHGESPVLGDVRALLLAFLFPHRAGVVEEGGEFFEFLAVFLGGFGVAADAGADETVGGLSGLVGSFDSVEGFAHLVLATFSALDFTAPPPLLPVLNLAASRSPMCIRGRGVGLLPLRKYTLDAGSLEMLARVWSAW